MENIRLLALDLDGTLLNSKKELPEENLKALWRAAEAGIEIVPATGRFFGAIPEQIRNLPFLRYAITINGAKVYDCKNRCAVTEANIPMAQAAQIMDQLDQLPLIYDCYVKDRAWADRKNWDQMENHITDENVLKMVHRTRQPVENFREFISGEASVQKITAFISDQELRQRLLEQLAEQFPSIIVSSSLPGNVEINQIGANKGQALLQLAQTLGIPREHTVAVGDDLNDLPMIRSAGLGIAMGNAHPSLKEAAAFVTDTCDNWGVAKAIDQLL